MNTRRQILKALGAGTAVAVAGCTGFGSSEPETKHTPTGNSGDISGEDWEEIFSHTGKVPFDYVDTGDGTYAQAIVEAKNQSEQMIIFAEIQVYAYDVEGTRIDSVELTASDWKPRATRSFEIEAGPGAYEDMVVEYDRCEIAHIDFEA